MNDEREAAALGHGEEFGERFGRRLGERLRSKADGVEPGPPPVDAVMRQGRRIRHRRHLSVGTAAFGVVVLAVAATVMSVPGLRPDGWDVGGQGDQGNGGAVPTAGPSRSVVEPYEPFSIGHGSDWGIVLRPPGTAEVEDDQGQGQGQGPGYVMPGRYEGQGYVLSGGDDLAEAATDLIGDKDPEVPGDDLGDDLSAFVSAPPDAEILVVSGTWSLADAYASASVTVVVDGVAKEAAMLRPRGTHGWGVYFAVFDREQGGAAPVVPGDLRVELRGPDRAVLDKITRAEISHDPQVDEGLLR